MFSKKPLYLGHEK